MFSIIPAKPFLEAKSRLAAVLSPEQRLVLSRYLLQRTISIARQVGEVVVISRDSQVRRLAKQAGAYALVETASDLNQALRQASAWVTAMGGTSALILPTDLPLLQPSTLQEIIELGQPNPSVVIAPCQRRDGTNGLLLHPLGLIDFAFGLNSFQKHQQAVQSIGLQPIIYNSPAIALDIDLPTDLADWQKGDGSFSDCLSIL